MLWLPPSFTSCVDGLGLSGVTGLSDGPVVVDATDEAGVVVADGCDEWEMGLRLVGEVTLRPLRLSDRERDDGVRERLALDGFGV